MFARWRPPEDSRELLGSTFEACGSLLGTSGAVLNASGRPLGASRKPLGGSLAVSASGGRCSSLWGLIVGLLGAY